MLSEHEESINVFADAQQQTTTTAVLDSNWYALYTRSRHEKIVAEELSAGGIQVFLPLRKVTRRWKDRMKELSIPLFTSYLFINIPIRHKLAVLRHRGVVNLIGDSKGPIPIPDSQIDAIKRLIASGCDFDPYPYVKEGDRVRVIRGPLAGVEGLLLKKRKKHKLVLSVDLIQQSTALEIDIADTDANR